MKICRVTKYLPGNQNHPGVQHAYFLTQNIAVPTLIIAKGDPARTGYPLPTHATLKEVSFPDYALTGSVSGTILLDNNSGRLARQIRFFLRLIIKLREILFLGKSLPSLISFQPGILHSHGLNTLAHGVFAKLLLRSRFVITVHSLAETKLVQRLRFLRYFLNYADKIICVSPAVQQNLTAFFPEDRLEVIPTGFDPGLFEHLRLPRKKQIVAVGYLKWQKDYPTMIEAAAEVLLKLPDYRLMIIGDGPERQTIEQQISRYRLSERICLTGTLSQTEIARILNESELFVMSSVSEGFPKALLEAMACGTPAVVTSACNADSIIDEVGIAVPARDSRSLAIAIETILADRTRWQQLSKNCLEIARQYQWDIISNRIFNLYKRL
jgi:glycosyltransferase involved in cell wall biosynthesis